MRSEYLKRCRELADKDGGFSIHNSPGYIKLLNYAEQLEDNQIPEELFDGYAVYENLAPETRRRLPAVCVSTVLDSVVELIKKRLAMVVVLCGTASIVGTEVYTCVGCP